MSRSTAQPQVSPDGRFAIRVDEFEDRGSVEYSTLLVECASGRQLARVGDGVDCGFRSDGRLVVRAPWNPREVIVDPASETFRVRDDQAWLPLTAWSLAEGAYGQGWANGIEFRANDPALAFPWVEIAIALVAIVAIALLAWKPWIDVVPRVTLLVIATLVAVAFTWVAATGIRAQRHMRDLRPSRR